jgi:hypothetical protein
MTMSKLVHQWQCDGPDGDEYRLVHVNADYTGGVAPVPRFVLERLEHDAMGSPCWVRVCAAEQCDDDEQCTEWLLAMAAADLRRQLAASTDEHKRELPPGTYWTDAFDYIEPSDPRWSAEGYEEATVKKWDGGHLCNGKQRPYPSVVCSHRHDSREDAAGLVEAAVHVLSVAKFAGPVQYGSAAQLQLSKALRESLSVSADELNQLLEKHAAGQR